MECNERYKGAVQAVFDYIDKGSLIAITSPVPLAECLIFPYRQERSDLAKAFSEVIVNGRNTIFTSIDQETATTAARLRAGYNLSLADSFPFAVALSADCDAFLTNDMTLRRVTELSHFPIRMSHECE